MKKSPVTIAIVLLSVSLPLACAPWAWRPFQIWQFRAAVAAGEARRVQEMLAARVQARPWLRQEAIGLLRTAVDVGDAGSVERLLRLGLSVETPVFYPPMPRFREGGTTPLPAACGSLLHWTASGNHRRLAGYLLARGVAVDGMDSEGVTSLQRAAVVGGVEMAEFLLDHGAEVAAARGAGSPLWWAAHGNKREMAELLLARGAAVDARDAAGVTPLMEASSCNSAAVAELLLGLRAEVNARDRRGATPLLAALAREQGSGGAAACA